MRVALDRPFCGLELVGPLTLRCNSERSVRAKCSPHGGVFSEREQRESFVVYFAYTNDGDPTTIPIGPQNSLTPSSLNGTPPTSFVSGTVSNAFSVVVPKLETATWTLDGVSVTEDQTQCSDTTLSQDPYGFGLIIAVAGGGLFGVIYIRRLARRGVPA